MRLAKAGDKYIELLASMATRHGLVTGATGSGKTVSIKVLAEQFSAMGVPVFIEDVKGDLSGFIEAGTASDKLLKHLAKFDGEVPEFSDFPTVFWDIFGEQGHALRTTVSEMGPMMLSKLLELNDAQMGVVYALFKIADDNGWLLLDLKDLNALLDHVSLERKKYQLEYGNMHPSSIGAIKRKLLMLESDGLDLLFGEPALDINDLLATTGDGRGIINVLNAQKIARKPSVYASFLLWLLSELFEELPEVGEIDKPKLVFFFDEAHILFKGMPSFLLEKVEQVIKLIRSKGVGIFFITQNPADIPDAVLAQLGNRIQHVLRAYTPREQKAVKIAAETFRENPNFKTTDVITELGVGEALISVLDSDGIPTMVERAFVSPPASQFGAANQEKIDNVIASSKLGRKYDNIIDRNSAFEILKDRAEKMNSEKQELKESEEIKEVTVNRHQHSTVQKKKKSSKRRTDSPFDKFLKSASSAIGSQLGRQIMRGLMGSITRK